MNGPLPTPRSFDVAIIGGALAGASAALLLRRKLPGLRVLIVEKSVNHDRRVGEATVEVSAYFLGRVLGLTQHLNEAHLVKQGMRFWFANEKAATLADCSEIGGRYQVRLPAYQVDRQVLDEEVLRRAQAAGAEVWRPAIVQQVELHPGREQRLLVRHQDRTEEIHARWVLDASGVAALLARQEGWWQPNLAHPTTAVWARWQGVKDWDGLELATRHPDWANACFGIRGTATNHLMGDGWWAWWIPLKGGDLSIGVVFDQRLVRWPTEGPLGQRLKDFLCQHPVGRELLLDAHWREGDVHWRKNLPYSSTTYAGDGFALLGDAGAFMDPFYSPGMDWIVYTVLAAVELVGEQQRGQSLAPLLERHNRRFRRSYDRWFAALYQDKYEYLGEFDLVRLAFLMDLGLYYLGVVAQPFRRGAAALLEPVFVTAPSVPVFYWMRCYNRRFARIARRRRAKGRLRRCNDHRRYLFGGFTFSRISAWLIVKALAGWAWLELTEGWKSWWQPRAAPQLEAPALPAPASLQTSLKS